MKHLIMGTAGHVDHGKTALIRALTGVNCDTHKEEQRRGITINLGFTHLELPSGASVGVVDVPGHHDFVHTMVGGASGMDVALLVVAADSGVMPQTREHLQIMDVLGLDTGVVGLTKIDLAEPDIVEMAEQEIGELVAGTCLAGSPVVRVSAVTGEGLDDLRTAIGQACARVTERPRGEVFRMFVDRMFSVSGFGTVVTGSVMSGSLHVEDTAHVLPGDGEALRVRRLERHGEQVEEVVAGDRASINLVGLDRADFERGRLVSDRTLRSTTMLDARLRLFQHGSDFRIWNQILFHVGTFEGSARIHLIDRDRVAGGEEALVQVHLSRPCCVQHGDRFVVRNSSNDTTLGGGAIIDANPLHHRRRPARLVRELASVACGELPALIAAEVQKRFGAIGHAEIADSLNVSPDAVMDVLAGGVPEGIVCYESDGRAWLIVDARDKRLRADVVKRIGAFHRRNPLIQAGRTIEELTGILGLGKGSAGESLLRRMLESMVDERVLKKVGHTWALTEHEADVTPEMQKKIGFVEGFLQACRMKTPLMSELIREAGRRRMDEQTVRQVLRHLVAGGVAYYVDGEYLHASVVDRCRAALLRALQERGDGMTVADFRDLVHGNRKICLLLLAIYDGEGVTERQGDVRVITEQGRARVGNG